MTSPSSPRMFTLAPPALEMVESTEECTRSSWAEDDHQVIVRYNGDEKTSANQNSLSPEASLIG